MSNILSLLNVVYFYYYIYFKHVIIMEKSTNLSYYTLYDKINSFNTFCETFWLFHIAKTVICIATSVTAEIATTFTRPRSLFKTLVSM